MKRHFIFIPIILVVVTLFSSCVVQKPMASYSDLDYNNRIIINNARYQREPNIIGHLVRVGLPVAGAVAGYNSNIMVDVDDEGKHPDPIKGALMGALAGSSLTVATDYIAGYGKKTYVGNGEAERWIKKAAKGYELIEQRGSDMRIIKKGSEAQFVVREPIDVADFAQLYPNSNRQNEIFSQALKVLPRESMPLLIEKFPKNDSIDKAIRRYIVESPTFDELTAALNRYSTDIDPEPLYLNLVNDANTAISFNKLYPKSQYRRKAVMRACLSALSVNEARSLKSNFGKDFDLTQSDMKYASDRIKSNYAKAIYELSEVRGLKEFDNFCSTYSWLKYPSKGQELIQHYFELLRDNTKRGSEILSAMSALPSKSYAQPSGIMAKDVENYLMSELSKEAESKVHVNNVSVKNSSEEDFRQWLDADYTAGIVMGDSIRYLVYGTLTNNSIFDLPISMNLTGEIYTKPEFRGVFGRIYGAAYTITQLDPNAGKVMNKLSSVASISLHDCTLPLLKSGETTMYAVMVNLGGLRDIGLNSDGFFKMTTNMQLQNIKIQPSLAKDGISDDALKRQQVWLNIARNGFPDAHVTDLVRNERVKQSEWDEKFKQLKEYSRTHPAPIITEKPEELYRCTVHLFFEDGTTPRDEDIWCTAHGGLLSTTGVTAHVDENGYAIIAWPQDYSYIESISIGLSITEHWDYTIRKLHLEPGQFYEINVSDY